MVTPITERGMVSMIEREIRLVNLLPHDLVVLDGASFALAASGVVARMEQRTVETALLPVPGAVLPLATVRYGPVSALPAPQPGVLLVVSRAVATEVPRADLVFPDLEVRDENRRIIGCQRLARFAMEDN